jgi:hypothetical protein
MPTFAVVTPSRGLIHSRTVEAVMRNIGKAAARCAVARQEPVAT